MSAVIRLKNEFTKEAMIIVQNGMKNKVHNMPSALAWIDAGRGAADDRRTCIAQAVTFHINPGR
jgi:hypothetical protein